MDLVGYSVVVPAFICLLNIGKLLVLYSEFPVSLEFLCGFYSCCRLSLQDITILNCYIIVVDYNVMFLIYCCNYCKLLQL